MSVLEQSLDRIWSLYSDLGKDTQAAFARLNEVSEDFNSDRTLYDDLRFWLVCAIRCFFSQVDAISFAMRESVVKHWSESGLDLTNRELARLQERKYLRDDDSVGDGESFNSYEKNVSLAFKYFPQLFESDYQLDKGDTRWANFRDLLKARNRLTHPQHFEDLLPKEALTHFKVCFLWITNELHVLLASCSKGPGVDRIPRQELAVPSTNGSSLEVDKEFWERMMLDIRSFSRYLLRMWGELGKEPTNAMALIRQEEGRSRWNIFSLRVFARAIVAEQEGIASLVSHFLLLSHQQQRIRLETDEKTILQQNRDVPARYQMALEKFSELLGKGSKVDLSSRGGIGFIALVSFRDHLTHPKSNEEIDPFRIGLRRMGSIWSWLNETTAACLRVVPQKCVEFQLGPASSDPTD